MTGSESPTLLTLPAEIRLHILDHVFEHRLTENWFCNRHDGTDGLTLDHEYSTHANIRSLLTCRRMYLDGQKLAFNRTAFVCSNLFINLPSRLAEVNNSSVREIRSIAFVADARHFRQLVDWGSHAFGVTSLSLDVLCLVLHRSSCWHYLFDFTAGVVKFLRELRGVKKFVIMRNGARVKGSFRTWCNRLVGLIMKVDHHERYLAPTPTREKVWWTWNFDDAAQSFCLEAGPPKPWVDEQSYLQDMLPLVEKLRASVETEEWNPDPRSRNGA